MTGAADERIQSIFVEAADLDPAARDAHLAERCGGDHVLRAEVEELLAFDARDDGPLETPVPELAFGGGRRALELDRVAGYEVLETLGEGGMGVVFLARQESPRRTVALKVVRPELRTDDVVRRFERESEVLGRLQHPGIAQIHEAGTADTPFGRLPFFAMEVVDGRSVTEHCRAGGLELEHKLALFTRICDAVDHAHQRGVVHRDLKPSNLLVDRTGQPKVLDFGIARLAEGDGDSTLRTRTGEVIGTLAYMSPEQVDPHHGPTDRTSDVYALGVILYELVAGQVPHDLGGLSIVAAARIIAERDPTPLIDLAPDAPTDLGTIAGKALAKEPHRRYATAGALRDDVERLLDHRPIVARPSSTLYQIQKLARRHRGLFTGLAIAFLVLLAGMTATTIAMLHAQEAEAKTGRTLGELQREHGKVTAVKKLLELVLASPHPSNEGRNVRVLDALERVLPTEEMSALLEGQPEVAGLVQGTVGRIYHVLGMYAESRTHLESAFAILSEILPPDDREVVSVRHDLALTLSLAGDLEAARPHFVELLAIRRRPPVRTQDLLGTELNFLGLRLRAGERGEELEAELREHLAKCEELLGVDAETTLGTCNNLARFIQDGGRPAEAAALYEDVLPRLRRVLGPAHPSTLTTANNLGLARSARGDIGAAEPLALEALAGRTALFGPEHVDTASSMILLGEIRLQQGRFEEAHELLEPSVEILAGSVGVEDPRYAALVNSLAAVTERLEGPASAEPWFRENVDLLERIRPPDHPEALTAIYALAQNLKKQRRLDDAVELYRDLMPRADSALGEDDWRRAAFELGYGRLLVEHGDPDAGWPLIEGAYETFLELFGEDDARTRAAQELLQGRRR